MSAGNKSCRRNIETVLALGRQYRRIVRGTESTVFDACLGVDDWKRKGPMAADEYAMHRTAWLAWWCPELAIDDITGIDPEGIGDIAYGKTTEFLVADSKANQALHVLREMIADAGDPDMRAQLDLFYGLHCDASRLIDVVRHLNRAEREFLHPIAWRSIGKK